MSNLPDPPANPITWKNTFNTHIFIMNSASAESMRKVVTISGYPYYSNYDRVFDSVTHEDTGVTVAQLDRDIKY